MTKLSLLINLLLFLVGGLSWAAEKPNIVIIIADDLGWNDLACYGNPGVRSPNLDKFAEENLKFTNAFLTTSSCSPSRASIMTGLYPHETGAANLHEPLPSDKKTLGSYLKIAGYYTVSAGKWHLGNAVKNQFDLLVDSRPAGSEHWLRVLQDRPKNKPFFMWFAAHDAHRGWQATKGKHAIAKPHTNEEVWVPSYMPDTPEVRRDLAQYYDEINRLDSYVGKVVDELKQQGVYDNTLLIFMSDNGRPFPRAKTRVYDSGMKTPFLVHAPGQRSLGKRDELVSAIDIVPTILELVGIEVPKTLHGKSFVPMFLDAKAKTRQAVYSEHNWHDYKAHERSVRTKDFLYVENALPSLNANPPADAVASPTGQVMLKMYQEGKLNEIQMDSFVMPRTSKELFDVNKDSFSYTNLVNKIEYKSTVMIYEKLLADWRLRTSDEIPTKLKEDTFDRDTGKRLLRKKILRKK